MTRLDLSAHPLQEFKLWTSFTFCAEEADTRVRPATRIGPRRGAGPPRTFAWWYRTLHSQKHFGSAAIWAVKKDFNWGKVKGSSKVTTIGKVIITLYITETSKVTQNTTETLWFIFSKHREIPTHFHQYRCEKRETILIRKSQTKRRGYFRNISRK